MAGFPETSIRARSGFPTPRGPGGEVVTMATGSVARMHITICFLGRNVISGCLSAFLSLPLPLFLPIHATVVFKLLALSISWARTG